MDYFRNFRENIAPFTISRLLPYLSITITIALQAHKNFSDLPMLAYLLATYAVPVSIISMSIAIIGNFVALNKGSFEKNNLLFRTGFTASLILAAITTAACLLVHLYWVSDSGIYGVDAAKLKSMSFIYIASTPFLVINTFLFFFNEAYKKASSSTRIESISAAASFIFVFAAYALSEDNNFCYFSIASIVVCEILTLGMYAFLSKKRRFTFTISFNIHLFKKIAAVGVPISFGLGGQKIFFFLMTERLIRISPDLVSMLSVTMSIVGFLLIPTSAFSQLHSLYISRNTRSLSMYNKVGMLYLAIISIVTIAPFVLFSGVFYEVFGGTEPLATQKLTVAVTFFLVTSGLIAFGMSQLRAIKDTLTPQVIMNSLMLLILYPVFISSYFDNADLADFLLAESVALFLGYVFLHIRTTYLGKKLSTTAESDTSKLPAENTISATS
ncbi:MAG: hypothetical protein ACREXR_00790 [Gammaproteobacteria bacterium]